MTDTHSKQEIMRELARIRQLPHGPARTAAAEAVIRKVENAGLDELLPWALLDLVEAYTFTEHGHKSFVIFAKLLKLWDTRPELFDESDTFNLFWEFKWVVSDLSDYPQISRQQAEEMLADMRHRYEVQGLGTRSVEQAYYKWYASTGDPREDEQLQKWLESPRDEQTDCDACMIGFYVASAAKKKDWQKVIQKEREQQYSCNREPYHTWVLTALAAMELGDVPLAAQKLRAALSIEGNDNELDYVSRGTIFELYARGGMLETALSRLRTADKQLINYEGFARLGPVTYLARIVKGLNAALKADPALGELPTGLKNHPSKTAAQLLEWAYEHALKYAGELDTRNGNTTWSDMVRETRNSENFKQKLDPDAIPPVLPDAANPGGGQAADYSGVANAGVGAGAVASAGAAPGAAEPSTTGNHAGGTAQHPDPARAGVAEGTQTDKTPREHFAQAEKYAETADFANAAANYLAAAQGAEQAGELLLAGHAFAEAALCYQVQGITRKAFELYQIAMHRLQQAGANIEIRAQVAQTWAPTVETKQQCVLVSDSVQELLAEVEQGLKNAAESIVDEALGTAKPKDAATEAEEERELRVLQVLNVALEDTLASVVATGATIPQAQETSETAQLTLARAAGHAANAVTGYTNMGMPSDAAHACWLLGKIQLEAGDTAGAIESLDKAFHLFAPGTHGQERAAIADELLPLLRQTGQTERAELLVSEL